MASVTIEVPELAVGKTATIMAGDRRILLCRSQTGLHATDAVCPHQAKLLEGGRVRGQWILCPHHGARFDLLTGASLSPQMTTKALAIHPCVEQDGMATVEID